MPQLSADQIFQQDPEWLKSNYPQVYSQYVEKVGQPAQTLQQSQASTQQTQAAIPGTQAESGIKQVQQQAANYPLNLKNDLSKGMTLKNALGKYSSLMKPDDVFQQYLAQSPYGLPKENPQTLQELGISPQALGQIGTPGSFMDRYNTKNAIAGLNNLKDLWNKTSAKSRVMGILGLNTDTSNYQTAKEIFGNHLSTLIPGAPGGQQTAKDLLDTLPNPSDPREDISGKAAGQFNTIEDQLLKTKGYSPKDLGLPASAISQDNQKEAKGGTLLSMLTGQLVNPVTEATKTQRQEDTTMPNARGNILQGILNAGRSTANLASNTVGNPAILGEASTLATLPDLASVGAKIPEFLAGLVGKGAVKEAGAVGVDNLPGALKRVITPGKAISQAGDVRDAVINSASKAGKTVSGNNLVSDITDWASKAKMGNLGQGDAIDQAISDAKSIFKGKNIDPKDLMEAYREADSGYTKAGIAKSPIQSNIDRGLRDILAKRLNEVAPGWQESTQSMAKSYQATKSPIRAGIKNLAKFGIPLTGAGAASDTLYHILFPSGR